MLSSSTIKTIWYQHYSNKLKTIQNKQNIRKSSISLLDAIIVVTKRSICVNVCVHVVCGCLDWRETMVYACAWGDMEYKWNLAKYEIYSTSGTSKSQSNTSLVADVDIDAQDKIKERWIIN